MFELFGKEQAVWGAWNRKQGGKVLGCLLGLPGRWERGFSSLFWLTEKRRDFTGVGLLGDNTMRN